MSWMIALPQGIIGDKAELTTGAKHARSAANFRMPHISPIARNDT